ncbi:polyamine aminopropyltransferase [Chitinimonas arctica]|uniref:Polyamine aminopropyltransferase n=1 Tax=Chitinimonas arctica TaxID=2594795 RepID=A0A516SEL2_9NEIS|nr:polyamine aminopropyltransferase [Chitinimonas arctica]QDQ26609.1 polyamine aminopropyltransferase [Chitinimonas arctica]
MRFGKRVHKSPHDDVVVDVSEKDGIRSLHLGSEAIQSSMRVRDPYELVLGYSRCMFGFLLFREAPRDMVMIGLGGGSIAKFVHRHMPNTRAVSVELVPQIVSVARSMFFLPPDDERHHVVIGDGAAYIENLVNPVDVIMLDAYGAAGIAEPLSTEDFFGRCRDHLTPEGVLLVNLWGSDSKFNAYVDRLTRAFDGLVLCLPARQRGNVTAICFKRGCNSPTWAALSERATQLEAQYPLEFSEFATDLSRMNVHNDRRLLV